MRELKANGHQAAMRKRWPDTAVRCATFLTSIPSYQQTEWFVLLCTELADDALRSDILDIFRADCHVNGNTSRMRVDAGLMLILDENGLIRP